MSNNKTDHIVKVKNLSLSNGEVTGIRGKSGSGKSTFLDYLSGFKKEFQGRILIQKRHYKQKYRIYYGLQDAQIMNKNLAVNILVSNLELVEFISKRSA